MFSAHTLPVDRRDGSANCCKRRGRHHYPFAAPVTTHRECQAARRFRVGAGILGVASSFVSLGDWKLYLRTPTVPLGCRPVEARRRTVALSARPVETQRKSIPTAGVIGTACEGTLSIAEAPHDQHRIF